MKIWANIAMSIDGRMTDKNGLFLPYRSQFDRDKMDEIRSEVDAILTGKNTINNDEPPLYIRNEKLIKKRIKNNKPPQPIAAILSSTLALKRDSKSIKDNKDNLFFFTSSEVPKDRLEIFQEWGKVIISSQPDRCLNVPSVLSILSKKDVEIALLESGPALLSYFINQNLIDRIFITVFPIIIGNIQSTLLTKGFTTPQIINTALKWDLTDCNINNNEVYLQYDKKCE